MKKFLLSIAALASVAALNAGSFKVTYGEKEVSEGETITISEYTDEEMGQINADFKITNTSDQDIDVSIGYNALEVAEVGGTKAVQQYCYICGIDMGCLTSDSSFSHDWTIPATTPFIIQFHYTTPGEQAVECVSKYNFTIEDLNDSESKLSFTVSFDTANSSVGSIEANVNDTPVYYNLQGVKVNNPDKGIYIVKRGAKVSKEIVK